MREWPRDNRSRMALIFLSSCNQVFCRGESLGTLSFSWITILGRRGAQWCAPGRTTARSEAPRIGGEGAGLPFPPLASVQSSAQCAAFRAHQPKREPIRQPNDWVSALGCTRRAARMRLCAQRAYTCALRAWPTLAARLNPTNFWWGLWWDNGGIARVR